MMVRRRISIWPAILGLSVALNVILLLTAFNVLDPVRHSLSFASSAVVIISLVGWTVEAREVASSEPQEEAERAPGPSFWPMFLAVGVFGIVLGLVYAWPYAAFFVSLPMAAMSIAFWADDIRQEQLQTAAVTPATAVASARETSPAPRAISGGCLMPVPRGVLAARAADGAAIAVETAPRPGISRRNLLRFSFWMGLGGGLAALGTAVVDALYPRGVSGFGSIVTAGTIDQYPPGTKTHNLEGKFWLVNLTEAQGGPGILALWHKCPHLGCTVPWREDFVFDEPDTGKPHTGWFRCPCHGSTYTDAGVRVFGPSPRSLDVMAISYDAGSRNISVNSGKITKGSPDNAKFATKI